MDTDQAALKSDIDLTWVMMMMLHTVCPLYFHSQKMFAKIFSRCLKQTAF